MNIFVLDENPYLAAKYHCDKHVVKMILETAQILSTVMDKKGKWQSWMYKPTHRNHPCVIWAEDETNFAWLSWLGMFLCYEYHTRYDKFHKTKDILQQFNEGVELRTPREFVLCMPDECKIGDAIESYRNYYMTHKRNIAIWKNGAIPNWFI